MNIFVTVTSVLQIFISKILQQSKTTLALVQNVAMTDCIELQMACKPCECYFAHVYQKYFSFLSNNCKL